MKNNSNPFHKIALAGLSALMLSTTATATPNEDLNKPIVVIGASYTNGSTPFNDAMIAPLGGVSVGLGSYTGLGNALVRHPRLPGFVINEAQAGATSFDRNGCNPGPGCNSGTWQGYDKQLTKALGRVTVPGTTTVTAKYVVITIANDCLHSDAFGIPQNQSVRCTYNDMKNYVDRLIAVGRRATNLGMTPIYDIYPKYDDLDLPFAQQAFGLTWMMDRSSYNMLRDLHRTRIPAMLPNAVMLDMWRDFEGLGDGLHPNDKTTKKAADVIVKYIAHQH